MNNFRAIYERLLKVLQISKDKLLKHQPRNPKMSDVELISLSLTAEYLGIDSENDLFIKLPSSLKDKIERSVYNRKRRKSSNQSNEISLKKANKPFSTCTKIL